MRAPLSDWFATRVARKLTASPSTALTLVTDRCSASLSRVAMPRVWTSMAMTRCSAWAWAWAMVLSPMPHPMSTTTSRPLASAPRSRTGPCASRNQVSPRLSARRWLVERRPRRAWYVRTGAACSVSATRDRRQHEHDDVLSQRGLGSLRVPDVLAVGEHVDVPTKLPRLGTEPTNKVRVHAAHHIEQVGQGWVCCIELHRESAATSGDICQHRRQLHGDVDGHDRTAARTQRTSGRCDTSWFQLRPRSTLPHTSPERVPKYTPVGSPSSDVSASRNTRV